LSRVYNDPNVPIEVKVGESFTISLESNPTTGYSWEPEFDTSVIEESQPKTFTMASEAIGAGGKESFFFNSKKIGFTLIKMKNQRSWEPKPRETLMFEVNIK
jgi:inhibitor of cysteine peptidase